MSRTVHPTKPDIDQHLDLMKRILHEAIDKGHHIHLYLDIRVPGTPPPPKRKRTAK